MNTSEATRPRFVVLAAVDSSDTALEVLRVGANLARMAPGGELHLLHVVDHLPPPVSLVPAPVGLGITSAEIMADGRKHLEGLAERARQLLGRPVQEHLRTGKACQEILRQAAKLRADVVLVGTHGRAGVERMLLGSVAEAVVRTAACPVVVVREKHYGALETHGAGARA
jgi:nucleotide-binding universal stress UspA family protein